MPHAPLVQSWDIGKPQSWKNSKAVGAEGQGVRQETGLVSTVGALTMVKTTLPGTTHTCIFDGFA